MEPSNSVVTSLRTEQWKSLSIEDTVYYIKLKFEDDLKSYSFIISDLLSVWVRSSSKKEMKKEIEEFNPQLEVSRNKIASMIKSLVNPDTRNVNRSISFEGDVHHESTLILTASKKISSYLFQWDFHCEELERPEAALVIRSLFIFPLSVITCELQRERDSLLTTLRLKQSEYEKAGGSKEGNIFSEDQFEKRMHKSEKLKEWMESPIIEWSGVTERLYQQFMNFNLNVEQPERPSVTQETTIGSSPDPLPTPSLSLSEEDSSETEEVEESAEEIKRRKEIEEKLEKAQKKKALKAKQTRNKKTFV